MLFNQSYTIAAASATRFASNVTGATWALTETTTGDDLAHIVQIHNDSATDHSGKTALITGTGPNGEAQTETIALPAATSNSATTKHFLTVTSVVPSATIGADTMDIGMTAVCVTPWIHVNPANVLCDLVDVGGTINFDVHMCLESPGESAAFGSLIGYAGLTADHMASHVLPISGVRVRVNSHTNGTMTVQFLQAKRS
jgi:hypothetical protein